MKYWHKPVFFYLSSTQNLPSPYLFENNGEGGVLVSDAYFRFDSVKLRLDLPCRVGEMVRIGSVGLEPPNKIFPTNIQITARISLAAVLQKYLVDFLP